MFSRILDSVNRYGEYIVAHKYDILMFCPLFRCTAEQLNLIEHRNPSIRGEGTFIAVLINVMVYCVFHILFFRLQISHENQG